MCDDGAATSRPFDVMPTMDDKTLARLKALRKTLAAPKAAARPATIDASPEVRDRAAFKAAMKGVKRLPDTGRLYLPAALPKAIPRQHIKDEQQVLIDSMSDWNEWEDGPETGVEIAYLRDGMRSDTLKKLRRGHWVVQAQIDLHGHNVDEARYALAAFVIHSRQEGIRCVRVIHGKGLGSKNKESVLKGKVPGWLSQRDEVLAFCQARHVDGGGGALIVLLRSAR